MSNRALLVIDVQKGFDDPYWGKRNNPEAESNIALLISEWRREGLPIIHIQHCSSRSSSPLQAGMPGNDFKDEAQPLPGEKRFTKSVNSAFIGTNLGEDLLESGISSLVIVGLTTDHCISTSTRMAANLGFDVTLVSDATAAFDREGPDGHIYSADEVHRVNLASLNKEFCEVVSTKDVLDGRA